MVLNDRLELAKYFNKLGFKTGAEIGVMCGTYSKILCDNIPGVKLYCIDPWIKYKGNRRSPSPVKQILHYKEAIERLKPYNAILLRMFSMDAVKGFKDNSLDFVFIDGNHDYKYVLEDITEWSKKVRSGGIVSGHDYCNFIRYKGGVIEAVTEYLKDKLEIKLNITTLNKQPRNSACFWWVKP